MPGPQAPAWLTHLGTGCLGREALRGQPWEKFRDRYGDWGRDLALYLARTRCGLKLKQLGALAGGIDYVSVSSAVRRFSSRLERDKSCRKLVASALATLHNEYT